MKRADILLWSVTLLIACGLAYWRQCLIDDAFISFTYARHFAEGHGLVWQPDSTEFGYTNFLFTLLVGALSVFGLQPLHASYLISVPSYLAAIPLLWAVVRRIAPAMPLAAWAAAWSLMIHYTVSAYATSGLETSLHMLLILAVYWAAFSKRPYDLALLGILALLCRLDSGLLLMPAFVYASWRFFGQWRILTVMYAAPFLALAAFLYSCFLFYGAPLPNTFYAKMLLPRSFVPEGLIYLRTFLSANAYLPLILFVSAVGIALWQRVSLHKAAPALCLLSAVCIWMGYILHVGGDFMEFRLIVPILPLFYAACFALFAEWKRRGREIILAALALNLAVGVAYAPYFRATSLVGSLPAMHDQLRNPRHNWQMVGESLGYYFHSGAADDVQVALLAAGAIPYFSRLKTLDIYGLNNRWVAQHGEPANRIAGHRKKAPFSYLQQQGVNLIIPELPRYVCNANDRKRIKPYYDLPALLIPLASDCSVVAYYLTPHPRVAFLIHTNRIELIKL